MVPSSCPGGPLNRSLLPVWENEAQPDTQLPLSADHLLPRAQILSWLSLKLQGPWPYLSQQQRLPVGPIFY